MMRSGRMAMIGIALIATMIAAMSGCGHSHTLRYVGERAPACEETGNRPFFECEECGEKYYDAEGRIKTDPELPATGHRYETEDRYEDCKKGGTRVTRCTLCGAEWKEELPARAHEFEDNRCRICGKRCVSTEGLKYTAIIEQGEQTGWKVSCGESSGESLVIAHSYCGIPITEIAERGFFGCEFEKATIYADLDRIGDSAFEGCTKLQEITLPEGLQEIGASAFRGCVELKIANVPASVKWLGDAVYHSCTGLQEIRLGNLIEEIGDSAFWNCAAVERITVTPGGNYFEEGNCLIDGERSRLLLGVGGKIPTGVKEIGSGAYYARRIDEVWIPKTVTRIGSGAFAACGDLVAINYEGNETEWENVEKGSRWNADVAPNCKVFFSVQA